MTNVWTDDWDPGEDWSGGGALSKRLPRGDVLGASVYELGPGNFAIYHFHHGAEELLVVLRGTPTLRTPEGERVLVPNLATRRIQAQVASGFAMVAAAIAFLIGRAAVQELSLLPGAILALAAACALGWGTAWLVRGRNEWRIGGGRMVLRRRFGARVQERFEARRLELTVTTDSDGDESFALEAVGEPVAAAAGPGPAPPGRAPLKRHTIARAVHDPSMPRSLGRWLSRAADVPLEDRTTREARQRELADLLAQLEASGKFGRWAARMVDRLAEGRKKAG